MSEEKLQAECYQWFHNTYPMLRRTLFAVPNGGMRPQEVNPFTGKRYSKEANRMKATGTIGGPSDLVWVLPERVLFIEMKTETGTQSDDQIDFEKKVTAFGHRYIVLRSVDAFKRLIECYAQQAIIDLKRKL